VPNPIFSFSLVAWSISSVKWKHPQATELFESWGYIESSPLGSREWNKDAFMPATPSTNTTISQQPGDIPMKISIELFITF
jgi:hypothetical protein